MFALLRRGRQLQLPVYIMIHLFDTLVKPVFLYGSEIWAHDGTEVLEKLHPLSAKKKMIIFWANMFQDTEKTKISNLMYKN